ncbi:MAG: formate/nitrite transporter family protein [Firmicutes bacterium]|nr:formate/nitrite transporter family protein [Bacillota bacterium]
MSALSPSEICTATVEAGVRKAGYSLRTTGILAFLAGAFIAFASEGSNMAAFNLLARPETYGLGKALAGAIFGTGLMLVVVAGGELFTGNTMMVGAWAARRISLRSLLRNWLLVYAGNFVGSVFIAWLMATSGLFASGDQMLGAVTLKIAATKTSLSFGSAVGLGLMCNWLVCLAVWMATGAKDITGKLLAIFFPIWLFITSGFEHSVANMYYIPAGIFAKQQPAVLQAALAHGLPLAKVEALNWTTFFTRNLLPVTLGNILGGALFVMGAYQLAFTRKSESSTQEAP